MKKLLLILLLFLPACSISKQEVKHDAWKKNMNIDNINLEYTYKLDNGTIIYIGNAGHGTWIWEKDKVTGKLNYISSVWFFYGIAKSCPDENLDISVEKITSGVNVIKDFIVGGFSRLIENLVTVKKFKNSYKFKNLTLVPIDKTLIEKKLLNKNEVNWLNNYHLKVYRSLKKYMNKSELLQLQDYCSNI